MWNSVLCCNSRPLPEEMLNYARDDTHYLLYIYDKMRLELWERGNEQPTQLQVEWQRSRDICLKVKPGTRVPTPGFRSGPTCSLLCSLHSWKEPSVLKSPGHSIDSHWSWLFGNILQKFIKPIFTDESYLELYRKQKKHLNTQQLTAFQLLFAWRDKTARREDESYG